MINTVNSKTFTIQNTLLDSFTYSENISLIIPSISFSKTFDNNSTLKNNLELEKSSVMPNKENSTVIILGHSGYNFNAYFNDLFDLKKHKDNVDSPSVMPVWDGVDTKSIFNREKKRATEYISKALGGN